MPSSQANPAATLVATTHAADLNPGNTRRSTRACAPPRAAPSTIPPNTRIGTCVPDDISAVRAPNTPGTQNPASSPAETRSTQRRHNAADPGCRVAVSCGEDQRSLTSTSLMPRRRTCQGPAVRRCGTFGPDAAFLPRRDRATGVSGPLGARWGPAAMFAVPRPGVPWSKHQGGVMTQLAGRPATPSARKYRGSAQATVESLAEHAGVKSLPGRREPTCSHEE